tara:strand:+ start:2887 stop:4695 length:1809 start_codon:yes stop_codon:yes gene_type:complete
MKIDLKNLVVLDCEVYPNYILVAFKALKNRKVMLIEMKGQSTIISDVDKRRLQMAMTTKTTFGFNSKNYDMPIILSILSGKTCKEICKLSNYIIEENTYGWMTLQKFGLFQPDTFKHFDVQEPAPGVKVSLKLYGGRMHSKKLQDLPIEPNTILTPQEMEDIKNYCENDLDTTIEIYEHIEPQMVLRTDMSAQYRQDLMSKSDAQIAEVVIKSQLQKKNPRKRYKAPQINSSATFRYAVPNYISFQDKQLKQALNLVRDHYFELDKKGSIKLPDEIKKMKIKLGGSTYQLGIGGLHSKEKKQTVIPTDKQLLVDRDVASYYPSIILNLGLYPCQLGTDFLDVYRKIVETRLAAKAAGDKVTSDSLKIVVNGSYGKLGSKWSALYSPDLMIAVTLTGQLSLLMLIEQLENNGISVVSANTDGFVSLVDKDMYKQYDRICFDWELDTEFELEETQYKALYSRDVNNYLAITDYGSKGKGIFTVNELSKNPVNQVCIEAVEKFLVDNIPVSKTIKNCRDLRKFLSVRRVNGGAEWKGEYLGRVVRWINSVDGEKITYKKNGNKVAGSDGAYPIMELENFPETLINYTYYIDASNEIIENLGVKNA